MQIPLGTIFILIGCGVLLLILWNLYHYSNALSKRAFQSIVLFIVAAGTAAAFYLALREHRRFAGDRAKLLIFPFVQNASEGQRSVSAEGFALADVVTAALASSKLPQLQILPAETIFEIAKRDSLHDLAYLLKLGNGLGVDFLGLGAFQVADGNYRVQFQLFQSKQSQPIFQHSLTAPANEPAVAAGEIKERILAQLDLPAAEIAGAGFAPNHLDAAERSLYYEIYFDLICGGHRQAARKAAALALNDTSQALFAVLSARATMQYLAQRRTHEEEWRDSLRILLPRLRSAMQRDSLSAAGWLTLGQAYIYAKKWNDAELALRRAYAQDSLNSKLYLSLAQLHMSRVQDLGYKDELELCRRALALNPFDSEAAIATANHLLLSNRRDEAITLLETYRRLNSDHLPVLMMLGRIFVTKNEILQTLPLFEHILALDPANADAYYNLGIAYYNQENDSTAIRFFERALQLNNHADARLYLAYIYERRNDMDRAIRYLRERIRLSTGDDDIFAGEARKHLYEVLLRRGEIPENLLPDKLEKK